MATLEGIVPSNVQGQLAMIEEIAAAPLEELRPLIAIVLSTFLVDRRSMELPFRFVDAIDATLRKVRESGKMTLAAEGEAGSPLLRAINEHRQWIAEQQATGLMAPDGTDEEGEASKTAYQPAPQPVP